jgi:predicted kinase
MRDDDIDRGIWLITGVMAVGKSTVAQRLAERFDRSVHLRGDRFRRMIVRGSAEPETDAWEAELALRYELGARTADEYAKRDYTVVWQDCVIGPLLGAVESWVRTRPFRIIVLTARHDVIAAREATRPKEGYDDVWTIEYLARIVEADTPRVGTWIDSSDMTIDETVEAVLSS